MGRVLDQLILERCDTRDYCTHPRTGKLIRDARVGVREALEFPAVDAPVRIEIRHDRPAFRRSQRLVQLGIGMHRLEPDSGTRFI